jgi:hypothetical protein
MRRMHRPRPKCHQKSTASRATTVLVVVLVVDRHLLTEAGDVRVQEMKDSTLVANEDKPSVRWQEMIHHIIYGALQQAIILIRIKWLGIVNTLIGMVTSMQPHGVREMQLGLPLEFALRICLVSMILIDQTEDLSEGIHILGYEDFIGGLTIREEALV